MIWLLIILNQAGGTPTYISFDDEMLCEAAAEEIDAMTDVAATCVYAGEE